jgi:ribonuclease P protein component
VTKETSVTRPRRAKAASGAAITFPKEARILRRADFRLVYDNGIRFPGPLFAAFCLARHPNDGPAAGPDPRKSARLGITVPRALGPAVERNRIKRRLRDAFRLHRAELDPRWDIVLNPRRPTLTAAFPDVERAILKLIRLCNSR